MEFITLADIQDKILQCDEHDVAEANAFLLSTALSLGVKEDEIKLPANFMVKRLGVVFACYNRCLLSVGSDATVVFEGSRNDDVFAQKLEFYKNEVKAITDELRTYDFTGIASKGSTTIGLWRA
ncbi:MAG: hypothetical protein IKK97_00710 [Phascolarctobacterium sp.]|nr:hypothetical protein [Phascolarctobacterium sp.]